ncbi:AT-hook motif nuclear-localized protein 6 [Senna tora]|uniref:AT-hook motif nuclear-localized protein n=1 Tax=Senna tora TaxID=362788 RepID=A0A834WEU2_9FABA|nr:AT-hook motif nuclear-localized protein 6 [Senna tora]
MEEKESYASGIAVKANEAPESHRVAPRSENCGQFGGPAEVVKKKRGRPRKYGPDGKVALPLSPMPISSSIPLTGDFSAWKRGRGRPLESLKKLFKNEFESVGGPGDGIAYSVGANFTPHVLTVNAGEVFCSIFLSVTEKESPVYTCCSEVVLVADFYSFHDVTMKVMSFSQQGSRAICILSANGTISNVTLRQPTTSGGTLTYEGRFEILSLSGSYMPTENGLTRSRSGGMSVSLAGPDGRVVGGGLAGLLVAAGPVQVVVGSFLPGHQQEHKQKKQKMDHYSTITHAHVNPVSVEEIKVSFGGVKPIVTPAAFQVDNNIASFNNTHSSGSSSADEEEDDITPLPEKESNPNQTNAGVVF